MSEIVYRKVYLHEFDSIGEWWAFRFGRATGVSLPWGVPFGGWVLVEEAGQATLP